jgi:hypothetical protein
VDVADATTVEFEIVTFPTTELPDPETRPLPIPEPAATSPEERTVTLIHESEIARPRTVEDPEATAVVERPLPIPEPAPQLLELETTHLMFDIAMEIVPTPEFPVVVDPLPIPVPNGALVAVTVDAMTIISPVVDPSSAPPLPSPEPIEPTT